MMRRQQNAQTRCGGRIRSVRRRRPAGSAAHPGLNPPPGRDRNGACWPFLARTRRGFSSVMAMFYVALFSGLAVAYTAMSGLNAEITGNARGEQGAYTSAESGLSFLRYHIAGITFDGDATSEEIFAALGAQLADQLNGTLNLSGAQVTHDAARINIPSIPTDAALPGTTFSARVTRDGSEYTLSVTGSCSGVARTVSVTFDEQIGSGGRTIMDHGIVSRGSIRINGSAVLRSNSPDGCSIMSLDPDAWPPIHVNGSGQYQGDFYALREDVDGGDIFNGSHMFYNWDTGQYDYDEDAHTHAGIEEPDWPEVDTQRFETLINSLPHMRIDDDTNLNGVNSFHNIYIEAGADPRFNGSTTITGLVYIEWPNDVVFNGSMNITGLIVCEKPPFEPDPDDAPTNTMRFNGSISSSGVENLPDTSEYAGLHEETGTFLLAPDYQVLFNGSMGLVNGTLYTSELRMNGSTSGTVRGSIIVDRRRPFTKNGAVNLYFEVDEDYEEPAGLVFDGGKVLRLVPESYEEG